MHTCTMMYNDVHVSGVLISQHNMKKGIRRCERWIGAGSWAVAQTWLSKEWCSQVREGRERERGREEGRRGVKE